MLSTVSAVQILATVDALDELESEGHGGRIKIGKCKFAYVSLLAARLTIQILPGYKTGIPGPLLVMSGGRQTLDSSTALSTRYHF